MLQARACAIGDSSFFTEPTYTMYGEFSFFGAETTGHAYRDGNGHSYAVVSPVVQDGKVAARWERILHEHMVAGDYVFTPCPRHIEEDHQGLLPLVPVLSVIFPQMHTSEPAPHVQKAQKAQKAQKPEGKERAREQDMPPPKQRVAFPKSLVYTKVQRESAYLRYRIKCVKRQLKRNKPPQTVILYPVRRTVAMSRKRIAGRFTSS